MKRKSFVSTERRPTDPTAAMSTLSEMLACGKRNQTDDLGDLLEQSLENPALVDELIDLAVDSRSNVAARAIWIVRQVAESEPRRLARRKRRVLGLLSGDLQWEVKAELCHILPRLSLTHADSKVVIAFFESCQDDASKIVRAWSLNGLYELSRSEPRLATRVAAMIADALEADSPAIRARARNILKQLKASR